LRYKSFEISETMTRMDQFSWIEKLLGKIQKEEKHQKSFYDIACFPRRETVITNVLKFYFEEHEEHGFERLFFDSLIKCLEKSNQIKKEEIDLYKTAYTVQREYKNIDLLLKDKENKWAIIIEHKIDHWLANPLKNYYESVKNVDKKIIIVLSLNKCLIPNEFKDLPCTNLLYNTYFDTVKNAFQENWGEQTNKHSIFLNDFLLHITQLKKMTTTDPNKEKTLHLFQSNTKQINDLIKTRDELRAYTNQMLNNAMISIGFSPYFSGLYREWNHFHCNENFYRDKKIIPPKSFRFFVDMKMLFESNTLSLYYELFDKDIEYREQIAAFLESKQLINKPLEFSNKTEIEKYHHLVCYNNLNLNTSETLEKHFHQLIYEIFLKDDNSGIITESNNLLNDLKK